MKHRAKSLEPAIPERLRMPRTRPLGTAASFVPGTPSYSARFSPTVTVLPMVYLGAQSKNPTKRHEHVISRLSAAFEERSGPLHRDRAEYVDELGFLNTLLVGYWTDMNEYNSWVRQLGPDWWHAGTEIEGDVGLFKESYTPAIEDTETTFSHPAPEGYSVIADHMSGETDTHGYWGSARDRLPRAQTDALEPQGAPGVRGGATIGRHVVVDPQENLCLLRSGQDWSGTDAEERQFYLTQVAPILEKGMVEIRDAGPDVGCFFNRYMRHMAANGSSEKTYSLSAWRSLSDLEKWCRADTHLAIFSSGTRHYREAGENAKLRLYHEMFVLRAKDQSFEYFNCHGRTGMLNVAARAV